MKYRTLLQNGLLLLLGIVLLNACGGEGGETEDPPKDDSTQVIKVEPQNFPVNDLPDSYFGKAATSMDPAELQASNLSPTGEIYPAWLDAIISRESIVVFASQILAKMPDEVEFVQTDQKHYQASGAWRAFKVMFSTRPSKVEIVVMGGVYQRRPGLLGFHAPFGCRNRSRSGRVPALCAEQPQHGRRRRSDRPGCEMG